jgi:hypothetical protein
MLAMTERADQTELQPGTERRRGLRIAQDRPVKVFEPSAGRYLPGRTRDVSATGLCVELPASAAIGYGRVINVHVGLSESGHPLVHRRQMIPARVVWVRRKVQQGTGFVAAGVEFLSGIGVQLDAA